VRDGRLNASITVNPSMRRIDESVASKVLALFPALGDQTCLGGKGERFGDEIVGTETGHLLEHLTIEFMLRERDLCSHVTPLILAGHTTQRNGQAHVTVSFENDLVAMGAMKAAARIICWAFNPDNAQRPDIEAFIADIHALRNR
jgi:hypothetical protein